jgi:RHS repeat-associated protein
VGEIQGFGESGAMASDLEDDTPGGTNDSRVFGRVLYVNGLTLDQPLGEIRLGYATVGHPSDFGPLDLSLHYTWRGMADFLSFPDGAGGFCLNGSSQACVEVALPGAALSPYQGQYYRATSWYGTLIDGRRDESGQRYFRNRYYDPASGRFTQEDPLGLAGGLNAYGFANGDPMNYSDPFGLCPPKTLAEVPMCTGQLLQPVQGPLEIAGALVTAPLAGGMGMAGEGITALGIGPHVASSGTALARSLGVAGEAASGLVKNTQRIASATGTAAFRVPDGLTATTLSEVKNVAKLSLTNQLRDFAAFAGRTGRTFELFVRSSTELSGPLQQFITDNNIFLRILK